MDGYLLDTSALAPLVDEGHQKHALATKTVAAIGSSPVFVSVIALSELAYGHRLYERANNGKTLPQAAKMTAKAQSYPRIDVTKHTIDEYAELKSLLAAHYLPNVTKQFRKKYVEDWIDEFTGKALRVDDNDLWICAQARQNSLVLVCDDKMNAIKKADPSIKFLMIGQVP